MKLELRALHVVGCGPFKDTRLDFTDASGKTRPVTVLAGANGSGKTTALELIAALAQSLTTGQDRVGILNRPLYVQMDWLVEGIPFSQKTWDPQRRNETHDSVRDVINEKFLKPLRMQNGMNLGFPDLAHPDNSLVPSILYFPHHRGIYPVRGDQIQREDILYHWVFRFESADSRYAVFGGSLSSYLIWLEYAETETYARVIQFLNDLDFDGKTFGIVRKELKAIVTTRDGQTHDLAELSSGEQNILIMLLELRRRLLPHSIVLIDEIENSLHPAFQYRLARALLRIQEMIPFQLIVTTHAPSIVEMFGLENTLLLTEF